MWKQNKKVLFAISGGIAAYKTPDILHGFIKQHIEVETLLTKHAEAFVSPLALSTLSGRRVWREEDFLSPDEGSKIPHITLAQWADAVVIAPCTANVLRIAATGDASTLLGALLIATRAPVLLFPSMNSNMLEHPATQNNIEICKKLGYTVVEPSEGVLACGAEGRGRLPDAEVIYEYVWRALCPKKDFAGRRVLVTAGPTHEYIDPVRFLSNPSSGKMGIAIAKAAWQRGAKVTLVAGPCNIATIPEIKRTDVVSASEMYDACMSEQRENDVIIKAAAVSDFKAPEKTEHKIKRAGKENFTITFSQNKDIAHELGKNKAAGQILVGFAAETDSLIENGQKKIKDKNLDLIVVNDVSKSGAGFGCDTNSVTIISRDGVQTEASGSKEAVANAVLDAVALRLR